MAIVSCHATRTGSRGHHPRRKPRLKLTSPFLLIVPVVLQSLVASYSVEEQDLLLTIHSNRRGKTSLVNGSSISTRAWPRRS